ncbi:MAG: GrdX family protein [Negativibacillus sp.]
MEFIVVTNNPLVKEKYENELNVDYADISFRDVLCKVRDMIHKGHRLLTHPLSGSVKPHETPYKSILVSKQATQMDLGEVSIIENSIITADKFAEKFPNMPQSVKEDFQLIDCTLITSGIDAVLRR